MKFLNGGWLVKDGFSVKYAANIYTANIEPKKPLCSARSVLRSTTPA